MKGMDKCFYMLRNKIVYALLIVLVGVFSACSIMEDDRTDCPEECHIRFKYDYNMKFANAFANEVKQVALYIFDDKGHFVKFQTDEGKALKADDYYMSLNVAPGKYHLVAWAGLDGESFNAETLTPGVSTLTNLKVALQHINGESNKDLHPLWHGEVSEITVTGQYQEQIVSLVKDTHRVRVMLQNINGVSVDNAAFRFEITDDNSLINYDNSLIPNGRLTYYPYITGQNTVGDIQSVTTVYAEMHTSRLIAGSQSRLRIIKAEDSSVVIDIPLTAYLMLTEMEGHKEDMSAQEYLDRQDEYSLVFFLDDNLSWLKIQIIINGWTVRFNSSEL